MRSAPLLAVLLLAGAGGAEGQEGRPWRVDLGLRLGAFEMTGADRSYDALYGSDPMFLAGLQAEVQPGERFFVTLAYDRGSVRGERVLLTSPPTPTGFASELTLQPLHLTAGWRFRPEAAWSWHLGVGPTLLRWRDSDDRGSRSASDWGGHLVVGVRRSLGDWSVGGEARYTSIPNAVGDGGVTQHFGEDDLGGVAVQAVVSYRLR